MQLEKIKKLRELALRGEGGEAENARMKLKSILERNGMTEEDIENEETKEYLYTVAKSEFMIFLQCIATVLDKRKNLPVRHGLNKDTYSVRFTRIQQIDFRNFWYWHKRQFETEHQKLNDPLKKKMAALRKKQKKDNEALISAYICKHRMYPETPPDDVDSGDKLSNSELNNIYKKMDSLDNVSFHKAIE